MGNSLSGDVTRLTFFGGVKAPRRFINDPLFSQTPSASVSRGDRWRCRRAFFVDPRDGILKDIKGLAQCLPATNGGGKGGAL
jgi:hypothetical protein